MIKNNIKFVTMLPKLENIHLVKDVGMIPYSLKKYYGYDSGIIVYKNKDFSYLDKDVKILSKELYPLKRKKHDTVLNCILYLIKNSKKIDVLHLYHFGNKLTWMNIFFYFLNNKNGLIYIHMDETINEDNNDILNVNSKSFKSRMKKIFLSNFIYSKKHIDRILFGVQTKEKLDSLKNQFPFKNVEYITNAYEDTVVEEEKLEKENVILFVGRVGAPEKRTDILLEGFKKSFDEIPNWKLRIVGPINKEFEPYIEKFKEENPEVIKNIDFVGPIYDRYELKKEYQKAKLFCLTSKYESFGLVTVEALANGCTIVSSDIDASKEIINNEEYGNLFINGNSDDLAKKLIETCKNNDLQKYVQKNSKKYVEENFSYKKTLQPLDRWIREKMENKHEK